MASCATRETPAYGHFPLPSLSQSQCGWCNRWPASVILPSNHSVSRSLCVHIAQNVEEVNRTQVYSSFSHSGRQDRLDLVSDCDHYFSWTQIYVTDRGLILSNMYRGAKSMWTDLLSGLIPFSDTVDTIEPSTLCQQSLSHFSVFLSLVWRNLTNMTSAASITTGVNWITHGFQCWTSLMLLWLSERKSPLPGSTCETRRVCCGLWLLWSSLWRRNKVVKSFFYLKY